MKWIHLSFFLVLTLSLLLIGCSKDDEDNTPVDPCENIFCLNDGTCINGLCDCAEGFTGPSCASQIIPQSIRITQIDVTNFPQTESNGAGWDLTSGPDIYPELSLNGTVLWEAPNFFQNAVSSQVYTFTLSPHAILNDPTAEYTLWLRDFDDFDANDYMAGVDFTPYSSTNGFPMEIELDGGTGVNFTLYVTYLF